MRGHQQAPPKLWRPPWHGGLRPVLLFALVLLVCYGQPVMGFTSTDMPPGYSPFLVGGLEAGPGGVPLTSLRRAFVTLLYRDFLGAVRTLGQSLRNTGTTADLVVLVTPEVSESSRKTLQRDGWNVRPVALFRNPNKHFASRLEQVYTKLAIFNMTEYDRVVFLDGDTLVLSNVDELFLCDGGLCGVLRQSELMNSGVMVLTPSKALFEDMFEKAGHLYSYTGGDQGFLNSYYEPFSACPYFDPLKRSSVAANYWTRDGAMVTKETSIATRECRRLPARYNGDWPLLFLDNEEPQAELKSPEAQSRSLSSEEAVPPPKIKIMHYTLGGIKPWHWVPAIFLPYTGLWVQVNMLLKEAGAEVKRKASEPASSIRRMATAFLVLGLALGLTGFLLFLRSCLQRIRPPADERNASSPTPWSKVCNYFRNRAESASANGSTPSAIQMQLLSFFGGSNSGSGRPPSLSRESSAMNRGLSPSAPLRWPTAVSLLFVLAGYTSVTIAILSGLALVSSIQLSTPQLGWTAFLSCTLLAFVVLESLFLAILVRFTGQSTVPPTPSNSLPFTQTNQSKTAAPSTSRDLPPLLCEVAAYALLLAQGAGLAVMGSPLLSSHTSTLRVIMYYSYVSMALMALFTLAILRLPASWQARDLRAPGSQPPAQLGLLPP